MSEVDGIVDVQEEEVQPTVKDLIRTNEGPDDGTIEEWKQTYGEAFVFAFSEKEVYIYRPLMRSEFTELQATQANPEQAMDQFTYEETICRTCVLWGSSGSQFDGAKSKGGTASTLAEVIMANSNFWSPQQAALYTAQL